MQHSAPMFLLDLTAEFGGSVFNPKATSDFGLSWTAAGNPEEATLTLFDAASAPTVRFDNIRMDVNKGLFKGFVDPILGNIREITGPIEPIVCPELQTARGDWYTADAARYALDVPWLLRV